VILVRGKPAAKLVGPEGQTIEDEQALLGMLHERQQKPGRAIPLEEVEAEIAHRLEAEKKAPQALRRARGAATSRRARGAR
jgi:hypothetical protein